MRPRRAPLRRVAGRGVVLLEILIALSLITGGGMLILGVIGNAYAAQAQLRRSEFAHDLARSKLAELEAGLINISDLDGGPAVGVGSIDLAADLLSLAVPEESWLIEVETIRSPFDGLAEVSVLVFLEAPGADSALPLATAKQLVRLREQAIDEYEEDPLLRGLPEVGER